MVVEEDATVSECIDCASHSRVIGVLTTGVEVPGKLPMPGLIAPVGICIVNPEFAMAPGTPPAMLPALNDDNSCCADDFRRIVGRAG